MMQGQKQNFSNAIFQLESFYLNSEFERKEIKPVSQGKKAFYNEINKVKFYLDF